MTSSDILKNLEIGGWSAIFLICAYGFYKLILAKGFASKCGWFSIDLRSKEARILEINNKQELELKRLEIDEILAKAELLKYQTDNNERSREKTTKSSKPATDTGEGP